MKSLRILFLAVLLSSAASCNRTTPTVSWTSEISHTLWRGERTGIIASLNSDSAISGLRAEVSGLEFAEAHFLTYVTGDILTEQYNQCGWRKNKKEWDSLRVADRIGDEKTLDVVPGTAQPVWVSVKVPYGCKSGHYEGVLKLRGRGMKTARLPFSFDVAERDLPGPAGHSFHLDLWQNPYSVARYHGVEPWSEEHFKHLEPVMKLLADAKKITKKNLEQDYMLLAEQYKAEKCVSFLEQLAECLGSTAKEVVAQNMEGRELWDGIHFSLDGKILLKY